MHRYLSTYINKNEVIDMNIKELCEKYGLKDLRGADLTGAKL